MPEPESVTPPPQADESALYSQLFADCLPDMQKFLDVLFASIFQKWGPLVLVAIDGEDDYRAVEVAPKYAPFCAAIHGLGLRNRCIECDKRIAHEVARSRKPLSYWCDWGLREIAVPILIYDVTVGVIFCGQKRLEGEDDREGQLQLEKFANDNGIEDLLPELLEKRSESPAFSPSQVKEMVDILLATSLFISQILYNKLDERTGSARVATDAPEDFFAGFMDLNDKHTPTEGFWNALEKPLSKLSAKFDSRCIAVVLETQGKHHVAASHGVGRTKLQAPPAAHLISSIVGNITEPEHLLLAGQPSPDCFLTSHVLEKYPSVDMVVFDKARLGDDRVLHLLVYFDPTVPHRNRIFLHQKKQALSRFLRDTASFFLHSELVVQLRKELKSKDDLLQDVVHQINQPLQGILADSENLANPDYPDERKRTIIKYFPYRAKHLARQAKLVQLAEEGGPFRSAELEPSYVNLSKLLIEAAIDYQGYAEDKSVKINVDSDASDLVGEVFIDPEYVALALSNVVYNAVKYAFPGTTVTIHPELTNCQLDILITDNGIEIKLPERESIFQKHERTELAKSFSRSGLGIGLFVTRNLMRCIGGDAAVVDSSSSPIGREYKGFREYRTTIKLTLPLVSTQEVQTNGVAEGVAYSVRRR